MPSTLTLNRKYLDGDWRKMIDMTPGQKAKALAAFSEAVDKSGGQIRLAMDLGCSQPLISRILNGDSPIQAEMAARIEKNLGIPRYRLRPDLFDAPKKAPAKKKRAA